MCVLRGGFSRVEQTLLEGGRGAAVIQQRMEFQELMRERFEAVIERATGRRVIGFMSGNQQHPDMMCEVFILAPTDLVDHHEIPAIGRPSLPSDAARATQAAHGCRALAILTCRVAGEGIRCEVGPPGGQYNLTSEVLPTNPEVTMP